jgi:hypothetical protein
VGSAIDDLPPDDAGTVSNHKRSANDHGGYGYHGGPYDHRSGRGIHTSRITRRSGGGSTNHGPSRATDSSTRKGTAGPSGRQSADGGSCAGAVEAAQACALFSGGAARTCKGSGDGSGCDDFVHVILRHTVGVDRRLPTATAEHMNGC